MLNGAQRLYRSRMRLRSLATVLALCVVALLLVAQPAMASAHPSRKQLAAKLRDARHARAVWKQRAVLWRDQRDTAKSDLADAQAKIRSDAIDLAQVRNDLQGQIAAQAATLNGQITTLGGQVQTLTTQRDQALSGLPGAIAAVALADFPRLVFGPARAAWPCDSFYQSGSYWSYSFDSPGC